MKMNDVKTETQCSESWFRIVRVVQKPFGNPASETFEISEPNFEDIQDLCCYIPIRFNSRPGDEELELMEDQSDLHDALESLKEPGSVSLDDFKKQLGI